MILNIKSLGFSFFFFCLERTEKQTVLIPCGTARTCLIGPVSSVTQSCLTLWPHGLQHARPPCPSPTPRACSDSCLSVGDAIKPSHPLLSPSPPTFNLSQHQDLFKWVSSHIRWPEYWSFSFSISPSNEYSGLISFRMDWLDLLAVQGTQEFSPTPQLKSINSSALIFLYSPTLTSIHDHWKNHSLD